MTSCHASLKRSGLEDKTIFLLESKKFRDAHDVLRYSPIDLVQVLDIPLARAKVSPTTAHLLHSGCRFDPLPSARLAFDSSELNWSRDPFQPRPFDLALHPFIPFLLLSLARQEIIDTVSSRLASKVERTTALHMKQAELDDPRSVKTGLGTLDALLKGGLRAGTITEFVGPPGACKSQLCLQASLFATLPCRLGGLEGKVLYFDAENHFRAERLVQMAQNRFPERYLARPLLDKLLAHVLVSSVTSLSHLESMLPNLERTILEHAVRLIVVDNIAVLARTEYSPAETVARQQALGKVASSLKKVACAYRIPVVIANQVMSSGEWMESAREPHFPPPSLLLSLSKALLRAARPTKNIGPDKASRWISHFSFGLRTGGGLAGPCSPFFQWMT